MLRNRNRKSSLNKFIIAKDEFVTMKLHFRYHTYLYTKRGGTVNGGCKYCQDRLVSNSVGTANENYSTKGEKGGEYSNTDKNRRDPN
jgi:hypothetical protein